jgi:WD40 repeat protein
MPYHKDGVTALVLTPDNRLAISASKDKTIKIWDLERREEIQTLYGHNDRVTDLALTPDSSRVLSASWDGTIRIWDLKKGGNLNTFFGQNGEVNCLAVTGDGKKVVSASTGLGDRGTLKIWELETQTVLRSFSTDGDILLNALTVTPGGRLAVTASGITRMIFVWDLNSGEHIYELFNGEGSRKCSLALSPDGHFAVSGGDNGDVILWDIENGVDVFQFRHFILNPKEPNFWQNPGLLVQDVAFLNNGRDIMSASRDGMIKIWNIETNLLKSFHKYGKPLTACAISNYGMNTVVGDSSGQVSFITAKDYFVRKQDSFKNLP